MQAARTDGGECDSRDASSNDRQSCCSQPWGGEKCLSRSDNLLLCKEMIDLNGLPFLQCVQENCDGRMGSDAIPSSISSAYHNEGISETKRQPKKKSRYKCSDRSKGSEVKSMNGSSLKKTKYSK